MAPQASDFEQYTSPQALEFYRDALQRLQQADIPFLVGGGYAFYAHTSIARMTKDLDLFLLKRDVNRVLAALADAGYETELTATHWLAKVFSGKEFIDMIFNSGNGCCPVDERWFQYAPDATVMGLEVKLCPPEESIWQKAFIMERERFDGADVAYLLRACGRELDWDRLIERFGVHWRVLLAHLVLFGFIFPDERSTIPTWVLDGLTHRLRQETAASANDSTAPRDHSCFGTLLSRQQYQYALNHCSYRDARLPPTGLMTAEEVAGWDTAPP